MTLMQMKESSHVNPLFLFKPFISLQDFMENHASWDNAYNT
jgi:hypothetical protein